MAAARNAAVASTHILAKSAFFFYPAGPRACWDAPPPAFGKDPRTKSLPRLFKKTRQIMRLAATLPLPLPLLLPLLLAALLAAAGGASAACDVRRLFVCGAGPACAYAVEAPDAAALLAGCRQWHHPAPSPAVALVYRVPPVCVPVYTPISR